MTLPQVVRERAIDTQHPLNSTRLRVQTSARIHMCTHHMYINRVGDVVWAKYKQDVMMEFTVVCAEHRVVLASFLLLG